MKQASRAREWLISQKGTEKVSESFDLPFITNSKTNVGLKKAVSISVTAGKGGVGKTSFAVKTAMELSARGSRVLLIDCDYNLSNTAIKLGIPVNDIFLELVTARKTFDECLYKQGGLHVLTGCNGSMEIFEKNINLETIIMDVINAHENEYDYIILDCPAGLQKETLSLNAYCDHRFFIVTPDKSSITDSYSQIKILKKKYGIMDNHLIVNRFDNRNQFERVVKILSETIENFLGCRTYILGGIPKYDCLADKFDRLFLNDKNSVIHKKFLKVLERFTDRWGVSVGCGPDMVFAQHLRDGFEQDVQQL